MRGIRRRRVDWAVAFEPFVYTVRDYVHQHFNHLVNRHDETRFTGNWIKDIKGVLKGVKYLHDKGVFHNSIHYCSIIYKPSENEGVLKIGDPVNCISKLGRTSAEVAAVYDKELFNVGQVLCHIFTNGSYIPQSDYPDVIEYTTIRNMLSCMHDLLEMKDLIETLVNLDDKRQVYLQGHLDSGTLWYSWSKKQPWCWSKEKRIDFLVAVSNTMREDQVSDTRLSPIINAVNVKGNWGRLFHTTMIDILEVTETTDAQGQVVRTRKNPYNKTLPVRLLRFIRNALEHPSVEPNQVNMGDTEITPQELSKISIDNRLRRVYPSFLFEIYKDLEDEVRGGMISNKFMLRDFYYIP
ncbi:uncharacterized protein [Rutidosis leptorrhynchoides]|uniref:uncharacterized protein n=1 Tax=Rutidosis leptorrhynchoides TaxID=125765 RepID=UPI003A98DB24